MIISDELQSESLRMKECEKLIESTVEFIMGNHDEFLNCLLIDIQNYKTAYWAM